MVAGALPREEAREDPGLPRRPGALSKPRRLESVLGLLAGNRASSGGCVGPLPPFSSRPRHRDERLSMQPSGVAGLACSLFRKGADFTAAMAFQFASPPGCR